MKKYFCSLILLVSLLASMLCLAESFVVKNIKIEGLQRIAPETVYTYLPIHKGQTLHSSQTSSIINALYKTGFFQRISLERSGDTLIIRVTERETIGQLKISGNRVIPTDKLTAVMKSLDIAEGRAYNPVMLEKIHQGLLNQYYQLGRYTARVDVTVTPMTRNRVLVKIDISEGLVAGIRNINIIGNHAFSESKLQKQMTISTPGLFTFITEKDRYSQEKLDESLTKLHDFYTDRGYVRFTTESSQVEITPDRKSIYITVVIKEGEPYTVSGVDLRGNFVTSKERVMKLIKIKPGDTFSRQQVLDSEKAISDLLGEKGYIFATVSINPQIDDAHKTVFLVFTVKPGKRMYVRHIKFSNNNKTNDTVLRREVAQMEGSVVSSNKLDESKRNLSMLPYLKDVEMTVVPVPDKDDEVDVDYKVTEDNAAQATASIGYSQVNKVLLSLGFNQKNFLGTGKTLGVNLARSVVESNYGINYMDPYFSQDGISENLSLSFSRFNPEKVNSVLTKSYNTDEYDASAVYGIPIGQDKNSIEKIELGYGYQSTLINFQRITPSQQVLAFVNQNGRHFQQLDLIAGFTRNALDKAIFPTSGTSQGIGINLFLPISQSLSYYTASYNIRGYLPLTNAFILTAKGTLGYGNSFKGVNNYPFFKNFYAGGFDSVRGYLGYSLGPKDSNANTTGGTELAVASLGLIFPNHISDSLRTSVFIDGGNVWNSFDNRKYGGSGSGYVRYSVGIEMDWLSPMGPIQVSLAKPLNLHKAANKADGTKNWGDTEEIPQFNLGANFG